MNVYILLALVVALSSCLLLGIFSPERVSNWYKWLRLSFRGLLKILLFLSGLVGLYGLWLVVGPRSAVPLRNVSENITYEKFWATPNSIAHLAIIDLSEKCLEVIPVRPMDDGQVIARTVLEFAQEEQAEIAINASFYFPFNEYPHWKTYPKSGDLVTPLGATVIDGEVIAKAASDWWNGGYLNFLKNGSVMIGKLDADSIFAISGKEILASNGNEILQSEDKRNYPRTLVGVNQQSKKLFFLVVDGKQAGYSEGISLEAARDVLLDKGATDILAFDGGGSATLVIREKGELKVLNRPIHTRIPNRRRPVANFVGLRRAKDCRMTEREL